jgi:hypothetical protein
MKFLFVIASLFATVYAQQFAVGAPAAGSTLTPGQNVNVQILVPIDTSNEAGNPEVALVIGILGCGTSACAAASADLGENPLITKFQSQGLINNTLITFANYSLPVPSDISGAASIQVMRVSLSTPPGHANPGFQFLNVSVQVGSGSSGSSTLNIHPNGDNTKCVGTLGGTYADGTPVDIFDCNQSNTQKWQWNGDALTSVNPADGSTWCLDAGVQSQWADGVKMKIWECLPNLPQQTWTPVTSSGTIALPGGNFCLDLTNGIKTNQNVLQIWTCGAGNPNQLWTVTSS